MKGTKYKKYEMAFFKWVREDRYGKYGVVQPKRVNPNEEIYNLLKQYNDEDIK
jgi:hypothetical protein